MSQTLRSNTKRIHPIITAISYICHKSKIFITYFLTTLINHHNLPGYRHLILHFWIRTNTKSQGSKKNAKETSNIRKNHINFTNSPTYRCTFGWFEEIYINVICRWYWYGVCLKWLNITPSKLSYLCIR